MFVNGKDDSLRILPHPYSLDKSLYFSFHIWSEVDYMPTFWLWLINTLLIVLFSCKRDQDFQVIDKQTIVNFWVSCVFWSLGSKSIAIQSLVLQVQLPIAPKAFSPAIFL